MRLKSLLLFGLVATAVSCKKNDTEEFFVNEDASTFAEVGTLDIGDAGAAEISAYDPQTKRLFVVNNGTTNKIDVIDMQDPTKLSVIHSISVTPYGGYVNSLSVNNGKLAAAIESVVKQDNGKVVIFKTSDYSEIKAVPVGALPDMVAFSADGRFIMSANEGEPNADYTNDPVGSVSIISVNDNYAVTTLDFSPFAASEAALKAAGLRIYGPNASLAKDIEPEYVTIAPDSKTAWVTLQENNAIAKVDLTTKTIAAIYPLGTKDYSAAGNQIDVSDKDGGAPAQASWKVRGLYQPDGIAVMMHEGAPLLFTVNEGDAREYSNFVELKRVKDKDITLDPTAFPDATNLKKDEQLGRLNVTTTMGDTDGDGDYDALYSLGARSFSIWNGNTGALVYDSRNDLETRAIAAGVYDDNRSDDKGVEPEGIALGKVGHKNIAFIGMERADAVAVYDVTTPTNPVFLKLLKCGDAPEGVLFIAAKDSPTKKSLLVVSSEDDGVIRVYQPVQ